MRKSKSEIKHERQKKKMLKTDTEEKVDIIIPKSITSLAYEYVCERGYTASLVGGVLMFPYRDDNETVLNELLEKFGRMEEKEIYDEKKDMLIKKHIRILPFSYGFSNTVNYNSDKGGDYNDGIF